MQITKLIDPSYEEIQKMRVAIIIANRHFKILGELAKSLILLTAPRQGFPKNTRLILPKCDWSKATARNKRHFLR